jgi:cytochrome c
LEEETMHKCLNHIILSATIAIAQQAFAGDADADLEEGQKLFVKECKICHGDAAPPSGTTLAPPGVTRLAAASLPYAAATATDWRAPLAFGTIAAGRDSADRLAFAPPFGPNLQGVYGRRAGTAPGFQYSKALLTALKDLVWDEASLEVWITSPQKWVPGVYMFYRQKDPEVRRKIIAYLKANRSP